MAAVVIDGISVVDFSVLSLEKKNPLTEVSQDIQGLTDQVYYAFSTIGFVYFRNIGIPQKMVRSSVRFIKAYSYDKKNNVIWNFCGRLAWHDNRGLKMRLAVALARCIVVLCFIRLTKVSVKVKVNYE